MISFSVRIHWVCVMETSLLKLHGDAWGSFGPCQNLNNSLRILVSVHSWFHPTPRAGLEFCIGRPHLTMVQLKIFWLWWYKSDMHSGETVLGILKLDLFLGLPTFMGKRLSCHAGQWQASPARGQPRDPKGKQLVYLQPFYAYTVILYFTFSTRFNKLHETFNTLV